MTNTTYQLRSLPGLEIEIPEVYNTKAEEVVNTAKDGIVGILAIISLMENPDYQFFRNPGIFTTYGALSENPSNAELEDKLYLRICINQNEQAMRKGLTEETRKLDGSLIKIIEAIQMFGSLGYNKKIAKFRFVAEETGLITPAKYSPDLRVYDFDLNQGPISTVQDPEIVWKVVKLARAYNKPQSGEHIALLNLVAEREEINQGLNRIFWHPSHYVHADKNPEKWQSLEDFLTEKGFAVDELRK